MIHVDHDIQITRLEKHIGVTGPTIAWICSYLSDWTQSVNRVWHPPRLVTGASAIHHLHDPNQRHHLYADNPQLYIKCNITDKNRLSSLRRIEQCINDVHTCINTNLIKVNEDKTVAFILASCNNQKKRNITMIKTDDCDIIPTPSAYISNVFNAEMLNT